MIPWLPAALLLLVLPGFAVASEVLLYGPGSPTAEDAARAEHVLAAAANIDHPSAGVTHVVDLPFPSQEPVWMAGGLLPLPCTDQALTELDPKVALEDGIRRMDEMDQEGALNTFDRGVRALPCTTAPIERSTLARLHLYAGIAWYQRGDRVKAKRAFAAAFAADTKTTWDNAYPPDPQQVWLEGKEEMLTRGQVRLGIDVRGAGLRSFSVDGEARGTTAPEFLDLYPGRHVVRYVDGTGAVFARLLDVGAQGGVAVSRAALRESVLQLAWGGAAAEAARTTLVELGRNRGVESLFVVTLGDAPRAYRFTVRDGSVMPLAVDPAAVIEVARRSARSGATKAMGAVAEDAGRGSIALSGGVHVQDAAPYALIALRAHGRLVLGLEIGGGVQVALRGHEIAGASVGTILLPSLLGDVRYRIPGGAFHPWFGLRGLFGLTQGDRWDDPTISPVGGIAGLLGFDVSPRGSRGFTIHLDAALGYAGSGWRRGLLLDVGAGAGLRF